jgi:hypothetical protein
MGVPRDGRVAVAQVGELFEDGRVAVDDGVHERAHREGLLSLGVGGEELSDRLEPFVAGVGIDGDIAAGRIGARAAPERAFPGDEGRDVVVVREQLEGVT